MIDFITRDRPAEGSLLACGRQYLVYTVANSDTIVLKVPRDATRAESYVFPESYLWSTLLVTASSGWTGVAPTSAAREKLSHFLIQQRCSEILEVVLAHCDSPMKRFDTITSVLAMERNAWNHGVFLQDTRSFLSNFGFYDGDLKLCDFSSVTSSFFVAKLWLQSVWRLERLSAIFNYVTEPEARQEVCKHYSLGTLESQWKVRK